MPPGIPPLRPYANRSGDSGVTAFAERPDAIIVEFTGGAVYLYDSTCPGRVHVEHMRVLARSGRGLSSYISQHVTDYRERLR